MRKTCLLISLLIISMIIFACSGDDQSLDVQATIPVSVTEVTLGAISEPVTTTGTVQAIKDAVLRSEIDGYYRLNQNPATKSAFKMGDWLPAGTTIAFLDNPQRENEIKFDAKKLSYETWQREFEKQKSLYEKGGVTLSELQTTEANLINARYDYENAEILLAKLKITAPFDGFLVDLPYYTPRTLVSANSIIAKIMDYRQLLLTVNLPEKEMNRIKVGQKVHVFNYSVPDDTLRGTLTEMAPALDADSRTFKTQIIVQNKQNVLRPGMFVKAEIIIAERPNTIVIPKDIITTRRGNKTVFVVEKGAALERTINTGLQNRDNIEVLDGLKQGERLVVKGFETLRDRSRVKIIQ